jgi:hypothetical protein
MVLSENEVLEQKFSEIKESADIGLEKISNELNEFDFNPDQSFAMWDKQLRAMRAIVSKSSEFWAEKKVANDQLDMINQSSLDEYTNEMREEEELEEEEEIEVEDEEEDD